MEELDIKEMLAIVWKNKILIILFIILGCIAGILYNEKFITPRYQSSTSIILSIKEDELIDKNEENTITKDEIDLSERLINTYVEIIKSETVVEKVRNNLNLQISKAEILKNMIVEKQEKSTVLKVTIQNEDPYIAKSIAEEIPKVFFEELKDLYNITSAQILDYPQLATQPYNINLVKNCLIGAIFGIFVAITICFIKLTLNDNIKTESDIEKSVKLPVFASIGKVTEKPKLVALNKNSAYSEVFRMLVSNIKYSKKKKKVILITSSKPGEGKSWVTSNLAVTYAKSGKKVLLIDADMRRGKQHTIFKLNNAKGLSNIIEDNKEEISLQEYINESMIENLDIITKGSANLDYSKLLFSDALEKILQVAKEKYEYILLDGTPNCLVADDMMLSNLVDSTLIVIKYDNTTVNELKKIKTRIERTGGDILGAVINQVSGISKKYEDVYYNYNYTNSLQLVDDKLKKINDLRKKMGKRNNNY